MRGLNMLKFPMGILTHNSTPLPKLPTDDDYSFGVEDELVVVQSPRENKEERRMGLERERTFFKPKQDSDLDFYDDADSEEERMLEDMTRGYTLDFEFDLDSKTALPRGSTSTQYSDGTLARGSMSSGYSSSTTGDLVAETPTTPPPPPPPPLPSVPSEELKFDDIGPSPTEPPPPPPHLLSLPPLSLPPFFWWL
ncbi:hypothetical protein BDD12DRAFT_887542 [Trichophaea hybrida]|nr:hypothetical protein BDD12DRAFT_887542 [Trichophaea hybrida]